MMLLRRLDGFKGLSFEGGVKRENSYSFRKKNWELHKKQKYHLEDDLIL